MQLSFGITELQRAITCEPVRTQRLQFDNTHGACGEYAHCTEA